MNRLETQDTQPLRALLLEDVEADAELVAHALRRAGFALSWQRVETEPAYLAALEPPPDVVIADHSLPQYGALPALEQLRARGLDVPFIVVSGTIPEEHAIELMRRGAADYLLKDRLARLGPAVHQALEHRRLTAQLAQAQRLSAIGELAAGVAHEVNNPLATISLITELTLQQALPLQVRQDVETVQREAARAGAIVQTLLRLARGQEPSRDLVQIGEIAEEALRLGAIAHAASGVELVQQTVPVAEIRGDADSLLQVVINLIKNAVDAVQPQGRGRVTVALGQRDGFVELAVSDNGPGLPEAVKHRVFDPFFTTKPPGKGTGLGLSICHRIIADHGGNLSAENGAQGGAVFRVRLPAVSRAEQPEQRRAPASVLVVHTDPSERLLLIEAVRTAGYAPLPPDKLESVCAGQTAVDVVLIDPALDPALLARLRAATPRARLVACRAPSGEAAAWDAVLPQRFGLDELKRSLEGYAA